MIYEEYKNRIKAIDHPTTNDLAAKKEYWGKEARVLLEFRQALREEYLNENANDTMEERVWRFAYIEGHSAGLSDIENYYQEVATIVNGFWE